MGATHLNHYFVNSYHCPVHWHGYSEEDRICSCRPYWATEEEVTSKAWREDHISSLCAEKGGACYDASKTTRE